MRFAKWRGMPLAFAVATTLGLGLAPSARADGFLPPHVLPGWSPAYDFTTGQEYQAPPIPYGHYAKDYLGDSVGCLSCRLQALLGSCSGLFHHGDDDGGGHGHKHGDGCGTGHGWFGHHGGSACIVPGCGGGHGCSHGGNVSDCAGTAVVGGGASAPSAQAAAYPTAQASCGQPGCHISQHHLHGHGTGCGLCGGKGCGSCLGSGSHGSLMSSLHGKLASLSGLLHRQKVTYFVGPGGPVPLTPGYVPYIVATRSPREFFAFPPMNPNDP
jgi:hypothetical protein